MFHVWNPFYYCLLFETYFFIVYCLKSISLLFLLETHFFIVSVWNPFYYFFCLKPILLLFLFETHFIIVSCLKPFFIFSCLKHILLLFHVWTPFYYCFCLKPVLKSFNFFPGKSFTNLSLWRLFNIKRADKQAKMFVCIYTGWGGGGGFLKYLSFLTH